MDTPKTRLQSLLMQGAAGVLLRVARWGACHATIMEAFIDRRMINERFNLYVDCVASSRSQVNGQSELNRPLRPELSLVLAGESVAAAASRRVERRALRVVAKVRMRVLKTRRCD
eukprot:4007828-Pleurochrysis_carterae.AAC.8